MRVGKTEEIEGACFVVRGRIWGEGDWREVVEGEEGVGIGGEDVGRGTSRVVVVDGDDDDDDDEVVGDEKFAELHHGDYVAHARRWVEHHRFLHLSLWKVENW